MKKRLLLVSTFLLFFTFFGCRMDLQDIDKKEKVPIEDDNPKKEDEDKVERAQVLFSEIRTEYLKPKVEFIELYAVTSGTLKGLQITSVADGEGGVYKLPSVKVNAGEFIVVHMRKPKDEIDLCIDELDELDKSTATESFPYARDLWMDNTSSILPLTNVILLEERTEGKLLDAFISVEEKYSEWSKPIFEEAALKAFTEGVWTSGADVSAAIISDATTVTRTFSRQGYLNKEGIPSGKDNWIIVASGKATPGSENSDKQYVQAE